MKKKTVVFVLPDKFADWEGAYLSSALNMLAPDKFAVKTVSPAKAAITSIGGFTVIPDFDPDTAPNDADALILVGGLSWRTETAKRVKKLVDAALARKIIIVGICDAAAFLGTTGALNNVWHTANDLDDLKSWAGPTYTGESRFIGRQTVRNENIITANGTAPLEFAKETLLAFEAAPADKIREWYDFHKLGLYSAPLPKL